MNIDVSSVKDAIDWAEQLSDIGSDVTISFTISSTTQNTSESLVGNDNLINPSDTYRVDSMGKIHLIDKRTYYNENGEVVHKLISEKTGKSILVNQKMLKKMTKCTFVSNKRRLKLKLDRKEKTKDLMLLTVEDEGAALELFKFLADNSDVEQAIQAFTDSSDTRIFYIYTNYNMGSVQIDTDLLDVVEGFSPLYRIHSHPFDNNDAWDEFPSGYGFTQGRLGDRGARKNSIEIFGYQKYYMYHNGEHSLTEYADDRNGFIKKHNITTVKLKSLNLIKGFGAR
ncbi:JAB-like toxin 1 domain-containing protein [Sinomicrobium sp.]